MKRAEEVSHHTGRGQLVKRPKLSSSATQGDLTGYTSKDGALIHGYARTSDLQAPIMELSGHSQEVLTARFNTSGNLIASGSVDRKILLWNTKGQCENYAEISGHKGAILDLQWSGDSSSLYSACADQVVSTWDVYSGKRSRKHTGHQDIVNTIDVYRRGSELLATGSDDATIGLWDPRQKTALNFLQHSCSVTAVAFNATGNQVFSGSLEDDIQVWDVRKMSVIESYQDHKDTVTSLSVSPDGELLCSYAMDDTIKIWNVQPFAPENRLISTLYGGQQGHERYLLRSAWSHDSSRIAAGSADRTVLVWDFRSSKLQYKLPGHSGTVTTVDMHPTQPVLLSGSTDKLLILGELAEA